MFKRERSTVLSPPPDRVTLCPECSGTVEYVILHSKRGKVIHFATSPCGHVHDTELLPGVTGIRGGDNA